MPRFFFVLVCLPILCALTSQPAVQWGNRIWTRTLDGGQQLVIDERGYWYTDIRGNKVFSVQEYCWRLVAKDKTRLLYTRFGNLESGVGLRPVPLEVLSADFKDGKLLTVFNQMDRCWACVAESNADGTVTVKPAYGDTAPNSKAIDENIGPAMKSGEIQVSGGEVLLETADTHDQRHVFQLKSYTIRRTFYYWDPFPQATPSHAPATAPPTAAAATQHSG